LFKFPEPLLLLIKTGALNTALLTDHGIVPKRTWAHAEKQGTVSAATARRLVRFMRIYGKAKQTFGAKAVMWLVRPTSALGGATPMALVEADPGARAVEILLGRIDHGVAA
jgi:putative toxin-antitoxin system antitoxin component (TIGR02293 family)